MVNIIVWSCVCVVYQACVDLLQRSSASLWRLNVPKYVPWLELNGLFVFSESRLNSACCVSLSPELGTSSHTTLFTWKPSPTLQIRTMFHSETRLKLKSRLRYELLHSASEPTFPTDNKELFSCITFLPLWPNLTPCSAFPQHTSIISALFHCDQIWHILPENPQL